MNDSGRKWVAQPVEGMWGVMVRVEGKWGWEDSHFLVCDLDKATAHRIAAVNELEAALQNFVNGVSAGAVRVDSDEDERLADALRKIHTALAKARGEQ